MNFLDCYNVTLNNIFYPVKNFLNIIMIVAPILLILSLSFTLVKIVLNPDDKKLSKKLLNAMIALIIIFFLPLTINVVVNMVGESTEVTSCYLNATKPEYNTDYLKLDKEDKRKQILTNPGEYEEYTPASQGLDFGNGTGSVKVKFTDETAKIVEEHMNDFNYNNFNSFMRSYGGAGNYIKSLGGVFTKYYGKDVKVKTVAEFQEVSEYVFGLMYIYGFDYYNGNKYCKWGGNCDSSSKGASDAFYPGTMKHISDGLSEKDDFDALITGKNEINMTTNCNWTVDMVYLKAGMWSSGKGASPKSVCSGNVVTDLNDVRVGDVIHYYHNNIDRNNMNTWTGWYHTSYIGEVYEDRAVSYDGGSYYMMNKNFKEEFKKTDTKIHGTSNFVICHTTKLG